mgnify:CR=1 FL=1
MEGYGAATYLRLENVLGLIHCALLLGKSRVAPLKIVTIPRLELTAATVAVNLHKVVVRELDIPINETIFWTDSRIVIQCIRNEARRFQTFVANRLALIHDVSCSKQWKYVPSELNPANHASRGLKATDIDQIDKWLNGPSFLWRNRCDWPAQPEDLLTLPADDKEIKTSYHVNSSIHENPIYSLVLRFSNWYRLQITVAW